jgi:alpha-L-fucosidase
MQGDVPTFDDASLKLSESDLAWWQDAKFGLFVHWGLYAIPARGEWVMFAEKIAPEQYAKLADEFEPRRYDPADWVLAAKAAGMRYVVLTARHHDGFALWSSPGSWGGFDAVRHAAKRDLVRPFVDAVRQAGLRVGLYYSPMDWRFPGYFRPRELPDNLRLMKLQGYAQVEELVTQYGPIDILWYDGGWLAHQGTDADAAWFWEPTTLNRMVRTHQPRTVISPRSGWVGDFAIEEGSQEVTGPIRPEPWEKCFNLNDTAWGYTVNQNLMTRDRAVKLLVNTLVRGGNLLMNVGPDRDGVIPPAHVERLREIGAWVGPRGAAIYGTRPGPLQPVDGVYGTTQAGDRVFVFVLRWPADGAPLRIPALPGRVEQVALLPSGTATWTVSDGMMELAVDVADRDPMVTIIQLTLE